MKEMEFVSEEEAMEYSRENSREECDVQYGEFGIIFKEKEIVREEKFGGEKSIDSTKYVVYHISGNGRLFVYSNGQYGFDIQQAKQLSKASAKSKAGFMTKNGAYEWRVCAYK